MKFPVLKKRFADRYRIRITAGVLVVALLGSGLTAAAFAGQKESAAAVTEVASDAETGSEAGKTQVLSDAGKDSGAGKAQAGSDAGKGREKGGGAGKAKAASDRRGDISEEEGLELSELVSFSKSDREIGKEESVYLLARADGQVYDTIVTSHLYNSEGKKTIKDCSGLSDIENTKGDETFQADGEKLTWQADGNDIYYRGTSKKEAPVTQRVTYCLDGKEIAPEQLAGKSGRVTIRFDYDNNSSWTGKVNGEEVTVKVPFAAVTALVLDERFTHVAVENGRLESNGDRVIAVGYALPGMRESLNVKDSDFAEDIDLPEYFAVTADVENFGMDAAMTIVANAGDVVSLEKGEGLGMDDMIDELSDASAKLRDGSSELADGLDTLQSSLADYASGMNQLYQGSGDLAGGAKALNQSAASLNKGIEALDQALHAPMSKKEQKKAKSAAASAVAEEFENGKAAEVTEQIYAALRYAKADDGAGDGELYGALYDGAYSANAAAAVYGEVVRQVLLAAAGQPADSGLSADEAAAGIRQQLGAGAEAGDPSSTAMYGVTEGMTSEQLAELLYAKTGASDTLFGKTQSTIAAQLAAGRGNEQISEAVEQSLLAIAQQLAGACQEAASQAAQSAVISGAESAKQTVAAQIEAVSDSGYSLVTGAQALNKGTQTLVDQIPALTDGITALNDAAGQLVDGAGRLNSGSHALADGMVEFDTDGISKIVNSYNGDLKPFASRLQAVLDAGKDYQSFSGLADGVNGSVRFVYKLDAVKAES